MTNRSTEKDAALQMTVAFRNGAVCEFAGSVAALAGTYTCRDAAGAVLREDEFSFGTCRCHRGKVCRAANPCPY